jgi:hypothetical protein
MIIRPTYFRTQVSSLTASELITVNFHTAYLVSAQIINTNNRFCKKDLDVKKFGLGRISGNRSHLSFLT